MKNILFSISLILFLNASAQEVEKVTKVIDPKTTKEFKKTFKIAIGLWFDQNYEAALVQFDSLLSKDPENFYIKFIVGDCIMNSSGKKELAIPLLETAATNMVDDMTFYDFKDPNNTKAPFSVLKQLGIAYRVNYEMDKAVEQLKKYEALWGDKISPEEKNDITQELKRCETAVKLIATPVELVANSVGQTVNGKYAEYAPVISADEKTLIFTSRRGQEGDLKDIYDYMYYEDIYITEKGENNQWSSPKKISENINTPGHEASIGLSVDGSKLLIYSSQEDPNGNIYLSVLDGITWSVPTAFLEINTKASEVHACFNVDGTMVYFASDRKGGFGGFDIYKISLLPNGTWSLPVNLGPIINTINDETAPFIHPDGENLYFASTGHENMGGYDIFRSTVDENGAWQTPANIGYPINTTGDDLFYVTSVDGKRAYYSSEQKNGFGEKDLYVITLDKKDDTKALTVMTGIISMGDDRTIPEDANIIVKNSETNETVGIYRPNKKTGKYLFILPPGKTYEVTYEVEGYLIKSETMIIPASSSYSQINKEINLAPIQVNESIVLNNVFFDFGSDKITAESEPDLIKLAKLLNGNKSINIEISGHTDSKGTPEYNLILSKKRAESVKSFVVKSGVDANRITSVGLGADKPIAKNQNEDGTDNPEGRQLNRRIELTVTSIQQKKIKVD